MLTRRSMIAIGAAAPAVAPAAARAQGSAPTPPSIDELLQAPHVHDAAISPDGEQLAILRTQVKDGKTTAYVALSKLSDLSARPAIAFIGEQDVRAVEWANNERLLIWITFYRDEKGAPYGVWFYDTFVPIPVRRVISVDLKGADSVVMFAGDRTMLRRGFDTSHVVDFLKDDPRAILMQAWNDRRGSYGLYKVDVYTGAATLMEQGVAATQSWLTQGGVPMLRMDANDRGTIGWIYGRAPGETEWKLIRKSRLNERKKLPDFDVVGPTETAGVFLVCQRADGRDTRVIRTFNIASQTFGEVVDRGGAVEVDRPALGNGIDQLGRRRPLLAAVPAQAVAEAQGHPGHGPAVDPGQGPLAFQLAQVPAHGHLADIQALGQLGNGHRALLGEETAELGVAVEGEPVFHRV